MRRVGVFLAVSVLMLVVAPFAAAGTAVPSPAHCVRHVESGDEKCYPDLRFRLGAGSVVVAVLFTDQEFGGRELIHKGG